MNEREYVEKIKSAAEAYISILDPMSGHRRRINEDDAKAAVHWSHIKEKISPWTAVSMCEAWLEKNPEEGRAQ